MKTLTLLLLLALTAFTANAQTILIADNNANRPTGANIFSTVQAAVNAAVPGDIVYVQPSDIKYNETVTISKRIKLKGAGFTSDLGTRTSSVTTVNLVTSADGINAIANSEFSGLSIDYIYFITGDVGSFTFNDIIFENCNWYYMRSSGNHRSINNLIIRNNRFAEVSLGSNNVNSNVRIYKNIIAPDNYTSLIRLTNATDPLISNNLFFPFPSGGYDIRPIGINNSTNVRIEHNVFSRAISLPTFEYLQNAMVVNNIFYGITPDCINTTNTFRDNVFSNNLVLTSGAVVPPPSNPVSSNFHSGINNIVGVSPLFTNAPISNGYTDTYNYTLQVGSPCIGAATTGDNIGPSGGLYPWTGNLTLKASSIPVITLFGNSGVVPQNQPVKSNIKAKAN